MQSMELQTVEFRSDRLSTVLNSRNVFTQKTIAAKFGKAVAFCVLCGIIPAVV